MSIKSDKWIRRMVAEMGMIEPFEPGQIKENGGNRLVSYGTSSYGYDVRCANEFKIFTNINSAVVDPKNFDENSFVDFKGEVCIIPPNSFALARTVEYFRIPRNVLTICLGKCVTGDTRVVDAESGAYLPITEMRFGKQTLTMADWKLFPGRVSALIPQGRKQVFEMTTKTGLRIRATANHPFLQLHGWTALADLRPGDRIAVARNIPVFGHTPIPDWESTLLGLMIAEGQCRTPGNSPTFTSSDPVLADLLAHCITLSGLGTVTEKGRGGYRIVNRKGQGGKAEFNRATCWLENLGLNVTAEGKFVPQKIFTAPRESVRLFMSALFSGDGGIYSSGAGYFLEYYSKSRRLIEDVHHLLLRFGIFSLIREKKTHIGTDSYRIQVTDREQILRFSQVIGFWPGSTKQLRLENEILPELTLQPKRLRSNFDTLPAAAWTMVKAATARNGTSLRAIDIHATQISQSLPYTIAKKAGIATSDDTLLSLLSGPVWDVVKSITPVGEEEVFDISVPGTHSFLANDLIVHNSTYARCGIIVNVTPLEPEWEGHVTLEFSNTSPLPAKIYANEGVAQVLFFESDEMCETSYKDRSGKYQGQKGVTLPKT
jgi:deoxycytidine triphosphate deaminase